MLCSVAQPYADNNNQAAIQLISNIKAHESEITDVGIMQILNAKENTLDTEKMLKVFGILDNDRTVRINQSDSMMVSATA